MNNYLLTTKLNQVLNTMDLTQPKAIRMLKRVDNIRNKLLKDNNNYLLEFALLEQCLRIAEEYNNEAMSELYNEMTGKCEFAKKYTEEEEIEKDLINNIVCGVFPTVVIILFIILTPILLTVLFYICFGS